MASNKTYTSKEVALKLGIAPVTLRSILDEHGDEIPSTGKSPRLRFDDSGVEKIRELRASRKKPRGRAAQAAKRNAAAAVASKKGGKRAAALPPKARGSESDAPEGYLSLKDIERLTQISYPTLMRYVKQDADVIPSVVVGSRRHFAPEAVEVFLQLRSRSRAGRKPKGFLAVTAPAVQVAATTVAAAPTAGPAVGSQTSSLPTDLAQALAAIEARLAAIEAELRRPLSLAVVRS